MDMDRGIDEHEHEKSKASELKRTAAIQLILSLTVPNLTSLSIVIKQCKYTAVLLSVSLPRLTELTTFMHIRDPTRALPRVPPAPASLEHQHASPPYRIRVPREAHLTHCTTTHPPLFLQGAQPKHHTNSVTGRSRRRWGCCGRPRTSWASLPYRLQCGPGAGRDGSATGGLDLTVKLPTSLRDVYIRPMRGRDAYAGYMRPVYQESVHIEYMPQENAYLEDWSWEARESQATSYNYIFGHKTIVSQSPFTARKLEICMRISRSTCESDQQ
ncbi:hypothetical protein FIBSPDRAFT_953810 [Athelia psychrophila]|uniref:Uncharacterized protein n=1 Tax=Athelia psychrophila TaxID=1759441 RepID=A0A166JXF5_9AGAM|nr:hypothetical protein FIBSPDRAFT_953810 [Fibularhizoctonia sp. CBS 109695]